jgi:hypothetical protein
MGLELELTTSDVRLLAGGELWIEGLGLELVLGGVRLTTADGELKLAGSWPLAGKDILGAYRGWGLVYRLESTELLELRLKAYQTWAVIELEALQELGETAVADSFLDTTFNLIFHLRDGRFLLYTWGLRHAGERGRWPEGVVGESLKEMPEEPFAPLVLWTDGGALALAPLNYFLTSPLRPWREGTKQAVAHGFHGTVEKIPQGTIRRTGLVFTSEPDPVAALYALGDLLLKAGDKERPGPLDDLLLKHLSYWNDYGAYYSEVFNPIDEKTLLQLVEYFEEERIPVGYFGLDLWYHFARVGWATRYEPQRERFPRGLGTVAAETGLPFLLHLSAFDRNFSFEKRKFIKGEHASYPAEPSRFYRDLGKRLKREEGACGIWHDWLWVQQESVRELRADPELAERWFAEMAEAFAEENLPIMLCMPTMGFHLSSTRWQNVIAARSYCDYLNTQPEQAARARAQGLEAELIPVQQYIRQNILVGLALHALGSYPFYDIFITNENHPEGFAEPLAEERGLLCAWSAGPVGIGDKLGYVNKRIIERLTLPDGQLAKPDCPPRPLIDSLKGEVLIAWTETTVGSERWLYLLLANVGGEERPYEFDPAELGAEGCLIYDCLEGQPVEAIIGRLPPARVRGLLLAPRWGKLGLIGLAGRYVPLPHGFLRSVRPGESCLELQIEAQPGLLYPIAVWADGPLEARAEGGEITEVTSRSDGVNIITVRADAYPLQLEIQIGGAC